MPAGRLACGAEHSIRGDFAPSYTNLGCAIWRMKGWLQTCLGKLFIVSSYWNKEQQQTETFATFKRTFLNLGIFWLWLWVILFLLDWSMSYLWHVFLRNRQSSQREKGFIQCPLCHKEGLRREVVVISLLSLPLSQGVPVVPRWRVLEAWFLYFYLKWAFSIQMKLSKGSDYAFYKYSRNY